MIGVFDGWQRDCFTLVSFGNPTGHVESGFYAGTSRVNPSCPILLPLQDVTDGPA